MIYLVFANDELVWVSWKFTTEECVQNLRHANEFVGAYVNAGARIHLYQRYDRLQEKALYSDTDSVIFIEPRDGLQLVETGNNLGDMTSELKPLEMITEFVSGGPKNYAYTIFDTMNAVSQMKKTIYKVRGITLNYNTSQFTNFDVVKDMILNQDPSHTVIVHTEHKIKRKRKLLEGILSIIRESEDKNIECHFEKGDDCSIILTSEKTSPNSPQRYKYRKRILMMYSYGR